MPPWFLTAQGIPTTRASLYNLVYKNTIPHKKFGRRTVFSKKELLAWIESRTVRPEDKRTAAALRIAESATVNNPGAMKQKEQAPGTRSEYAGANNGTGKYTQSGNDMQILFGHHQRRVYNFLLQGGRHSVADISAALRLSDPRALIRDLRHKGIAISDEWVKAEHGGRFKRYFIRKEVRDE